MRAFRTAAEETARGAAENGRRNWYHLAMIDPSNPLTPAEAARLIVAAALIDAVERNSPDEVRQILTHVLNGRTHMRDHVAAVVDDLCAQRLIGRHRPGAG